MHGDKYVEGKLFSVVLPVSKTNYYINTFNKLDYRLID